MYALPDYQNRLAQTLHRLWQSPYAMVHGLFASGDIPPEIYDWSALEGQGVWYQKPADANTAEGAATKFIYLYMAGKFPPPVQFQATPQPTLPRAQIPRMISRGAMAGTLMEGTVGAFGPASATRPVAAGVSVKPAVVTWDDHLTYTGAGHLVIRPLPSFIAGEKLYEASAVSEVLVPMQPGQPAPALPYVPMPLISLYAYSLTASANTTWNYLVSAVRSRFPMPANFLATLRQAMPQRSWSANSADQYALLLRRSDAAGALRDYVLD
jgi:hypothetical protein